MGMETERDVIRQRLNTNWGSTTEISWEGFNLGPYTQKEGVEYIRPHIEDGISEWVSIAASVQKERKYGTLIIEVFTPIGTGDERGNRLCDLLIEDFSPYTSGGVRFDRRGFARDSGTDGLFHTWQVFLPYYRENVVSI